MEIEELKSHLVAFVAWMWEHSRYQLVALSRYDADTIEDTELLKLIREFIDERLKATA